MKKVVKTKPSKIPIFQTLQEEQQFWQTHSVLDFPDQFKKIDMDFSQLKPSTKSISIRLPESMVKALKSMANVRDVPYQSLVKTILADRLKQERVGF